MTHIPPTPSSSGGSSPAPESEQSRGKSPGAADSPADAAAVIKQQASKAMQGVKPASYWVERCLNQLVANDTAKQLRAETATSSPNLGRLQYLNDVRIIQLEHALSKTDVMKNDVSTLSSTYYQECHKSRQGFISRVQSSLTEQEVYSVLKTLHLSEPDRQAGIAQVINTEPEMELFLICKTGPIRGLATIREDIWTLRFPQCDQCGEAELRGQILEAVVIFLAHNPSAAASDVSTLVEKLYQVLQNSTQERFRTREAVSAFAFEAASMRRNGQLIPNFAI